LTPSQTRYQAALRPELVNYGACADNGACANDPNQLTRDISRGEGAAGGWQSFLLTRAMVNPLATR
jgi:hypothetical protein